MVPAPDRGTRREHQWLVLQSAVGGEGNLPEGHSTTTTGGELDVASTLCAVVSGGHLRSAAGEYDRGAGANCQDR